MNITKTIFKFGKNLNGRNYNKEIAEQIIEQAKVLIDNQTSYGELTNYESGTDIVNSGGISHFFTRLFIDGNSLCADIQILDLPLGRILKDELDSFCFVPRGIGATDSNGNLKDYKFITIDAILKSNSSFNLE